MMPCQAADPRQAMYDAFFELQAASPMVVFNRVVGKVDVPRLSAAIEAALPNAVQHRRRDYEAAAMMQELLLRNGLRGKCTASTNNQQRLDGHNYGLGPADESNSWVYSVG